MAGSFYPGGIYPGEYSINADVLTQVQGVVAYAVDLSEYRAEDPPPPWLVEPAALVTDDPETRFLPGIYHEEDDESAGEHTWLLYEDSVDAIFGAIDEAEELLEDAEEFIQALIEDAAASTPTVSGTVCFAVDLSEYRAEEFLPFSLIEDAQVVADDPEVRPLSFVEDEGEDDPYDEISRLLLFDVVDDSETRTQIGEEHEFEDADQSYGPAALIEDAAAVVDNPETRSFVFDWEDEETEREVDRIINLLPDAPVIRTVVEWLVRARRRGIR